MMFMVKFLHYLAVTICVASLIYLIVYYKDIGAGSATFAIIINILCIPANLTILDSYRE